MRKDCSVSLTTRCHTTHTLHHKSASFDQQHCPRKHICFKPTSFLATMSLFSFLNLSPAEATAKNKTIPALGVSIATSITSHSTNSSAAISHDDFALLSKPQGTPIHAPPGPRPLCAGARSITKTQLQIKCRATKEAKAKAAEDKKLTVTAHRTEAQAKKQERQEKLISSAKARAAKAVTKANELRIKQAKTATTPTSLHGPGAGTPCSHEKSKGNTGISSLCSSGPPVFQQYPQRKITSANKRVSVYSQLRLPIRQLSTAREDLSSEGSNSSDSSDDDVLLVGKDSSKSSGSDSLIYTSCRNILYCKRRAEPRGRRHYASPAARNYRGSPSRKADTLDDSYSSSLWTNNVNNGNMSPGSDNKSASSDANPFLSPPSVKPTTLFGNHGPNSLQTDKEETDILDGIWPGSHNVTLLTRFVTCHFSGDWSAYLPFAHWADSKSLGHPSTSISIDKWLSLKSGWEHVVEDDSGACGNSQGGNVGCNKLCNKTVVDVNSSPPTAGAGTPLAP
jgi:hypothetical protein